MEMFDACLKLSILVVDQGVIKHYARKSLCHKFNFEPIDERTMKKFNMTDMVILEKSSIEEAFYFRDDL